MFMGLYTPPGSYLDSKLNLNLKREIHHSPYFS